MAQPSRPDEIGSVPMWLIALLGVAWLLLTLTTIGYVIGFGPLA